MDEQYNNMEIVEGFNIKDKEINAVDKKIKLKSISGNKDNVKEIISLALIFLGLAIIISYLGATLLFFVWSIGIKNCSKNQNKNLFEYIFPTFCDNEEFCKSEVNRKSNMEGGSGGSGFSDIKSTLNEYKDNINNYFKDVKDCVKKNQNIEDFCHSVDRSVKKNNWDNPGIYEWFLKSYKESNYFVNENLIKNVLLIMPGGSMCGLTFALAWIFYILLFFVTITVLPFISGGLFLFNTVVNGFDYFMNKNKDGDISKIIKLVVGLIISFSTFLLVGGANSFALFFKMLFYPLVIGGGDIILKIIKQNFFIIKLMLILSSIIFISLLSDKVNKNVYNGIVMAYVPLLLINIKDLL